MGAPGGSSTFTLALYIAIGIPGAAFGQAKNETVVPMTRWVPPPPIERYEDPPPALSLMVGVATPMVALPPSLERVVVMTRGSMVSDGIISTTG